MSSGENNESQGVVGADQELGPKETVPLQETQAEKAPKAEESPETSKSDELFAQLIELGFDDLTAGIALRRTDYKGVEEAIAWIVDRSNPSDLEDEDDEEEDSEDEEEENEEEMGAATSSDAVAVLRAIQKNSRTHKMVLVANMGLKMGTGKLAAQVGHATLAVYKQAMASEEGAAGIDSWTRRGQVKIVVKGESTEHLMDLYKEAKDKNLFAYLVQDAGYTQIPPGSRTVLGLFGPKEDVDSVTGKLRLL